MSKGSNPRPFSVSNEDYANRWDAIFGKEKFVEKEKEMSSYAELEMKVVQWSEARKIIPNSTPRAQAIKAMEEVDELFSAIEQNDRYEAIDAIGDIVVCLINVCALLDVNLTDCLEAAYETIKHRRGHMNEEGIFVKEQ